MTHAAPVPLETTSRGETAPPRHHTQKRTDIEGLRAIAVSLVVLSHSGVALVGGGYIGVDVFFVISGFLITSLLLRELSTTGRISIRRFYARRALRLLPASTIVVVFTVIGSWLWLTPVRFAEYTKDALASTLYAINFRLAITGTDYLQEGSPPSPFQHFWSLAVEEQFYLVWPLLLIVSAWLLGRGGRTSRTRWLAIPLIGLSVASLALSIVETPRSAPWSYFGSQTRVWELGAGALVALAAARLARTPRPVAAAMTWAGLAAILVAAVVFDDNTPFPGYHAILPVAGTALVIAGGTAAARGDARSLLGLAPFQRIGGLSYGWYLWHWPLLVIGPAALSMHGTVWLNLALCGIGLIMAAITLYLVENPVRFHRAFKNRPGRAISLGVSLSAGAAVITLVAAGLPPSIPYGPPVPDLAKAMASAPDPEAFLKSSLAEGLPQDRLPSNLTPSLTTVKGDHAIVYDNGCHVGYDSTQEPTCAFGDLTANKSVVLFGDSHAASWFPALDKLARERHWKLYSWTKASCKVASIQLVRNGKAYKSCTTWRDQAIARIKKLHPALVVLSNSEEGTIFPKTADNPAAWGAGFTTTLKRIKAPGTKIALIQDIPWPKGDAPECLAQNPRVPSMCTNKLPDALASKDRRAAIADAATKAKIKLIDPTTWFCGTSGSCPPVVGNLLVYRDEGHMTSQYAELLAPLLETRLPKI
ncbi:acyltransferase [Planotetraspora thailandica]|uniref:Acyltransferase n=1 Tax=Planotetraspora thailandica TaxID=487172 RepID=A0A8J3V509_9ACTN|nr:acyltransferase family protein [Planotetraspora thailandica]GII55662.1 acyltransferase [Planotetraspora thailandica]